MSWLGKETKIRGGGKTLDVAQKAGWRDSCGGGLDSKKGAGAWLL